MSRFDLFFVVVDERDEYLDTNIATHIVNLHRRKEEAVKPIFSQKEVLIYLKFCRQIKPKFTRDAAELMRKEYVKLRSNDGTSKKTSYRITVRQLESLVRLSEALAKVHADSDIRPQYVAEAVRLLGKSIITIKKEGVEIEEAQAGFDDIQRNRVNEREGQQQDMEVDGSKKEVDNKIQLSYEEYDKIGKQLIFLVNKMNKEKEQSGERGIGLKQNDLVEMYLKDEVNDINSVEQLEGFVKKLNSVIQRLVTKENVFIVVEDAQDKSDRVLTLNVNIVDMDDFTAQ